MLTEINFEHAHLPVLAQMETKRNDRRFIVNQPALLSTAAAPGQIWPARIRDISRRGMQFVLDRPFLNETQVLISWNGREIRGTIRYQHRQGLDYRLGVELSSSWDSLVSDILAQQTEELQQSNLALEEQTAALRRTERDLVLHAQALKKSNQELAVALDAAREASVAKSRFLASVSHELRTPLNGIIGFSQLLHDEVVGPMTADQKEYLTDVLNCSNHLLTLINHVLDLTKIEAGKMEFHYEPLALDEQLTEAVDSMKALAAAKRLDMRLVLGPELGIVVADAARLRQVVINYLSNAVKFTPEEGRITVEVRRLSPHHYQIAVEDNGIGISEADLSRLFTEFGQLGASEKAQTGTGLGLVITKRIVEAQGGRVGVESVLGKGSRFFAVLPCVPKG
ncbi:MAG TPA: ATP-binding protein [Bryobacteraceae bacterium]|nr:ATP-binding protein [Bryobacteraceae bacterium]